jgi:PAS domain S-box-containing protein
VADARQVLATLEPISREVERETGECYLVRLRPYRTADGHIDGVVLTFVEITERKHAEEALRASEERLRRALDIETVGVIFFKVDGSITHSNDTFLRMSGYSRADLEHGLVRWGTMTPPEWMPQSWKAVQEFLTLGRIMPYEKQYIRKDGSRWWALFAGTRLNAEEGVEFIVDITDRKQAEADLAASRRKLAAIAEREQQRLAHTLHDTAIQELLTIKYQLEALQRSRSSRRRRGADEMALQDALTATRDGVLQVVAHLRTLTGELRPAGLDDLGLALTLEGYVTRLRRETPPDGPRIVLDLAPLPRRLPPVVEHCLFRVAQEALRNALYHAHARQIRVCLRVDEEAVTLSIVDDGRGFVLPAQLSALAQAGHFGLVGMAERAEQVGGELVLQTQPGAGTTVTVRVLLTGEDGDGA